MPDCPEIGAQDDPAIDWPQDASKPPPRTLTPPEPRTPAVEAPRHERGPRPHPMQEVIMDANGIARFRQNRVVRTLFDHASSDGLDMNEIVARFRREDGDDLAQFLQLIGYSVSGFGELSYVDQQAVELADRRAEALRKD